MASTKQKVFKAGNSLVVVIPAVFRNVLGIKDGDEVKVEVDMEKQSVSYKFTSSRQLTLLRRRSQKGRKK
ncbi:hypothetical protein B5M47_00665 [candidate division CPR3 bacterium 4484_211]|uniref:SpoVT-AbrB domain-containing protein n=1 Tax=candidate division CPR3 bacterium 4484_211 TaxID=1968527 RepID=A0A1W9NZI0_UNCC3|nr:MAG: hypothetical protein B5M47_00665 [candidate division CPR3 bacterium 4484_211]